MARLSSIFWRCHKESRGRDTSLQGEAVSLTDAPNNLLPRLNSVKARQSALGAQWRLPQEVRLRGREERRVLNR